MSKIRPRHTLPDILDRMKALDEAIDLVGGVIATEATADQIRRSAGVMSRMATLSKGIVEDLRAADGIAKQREIHWKRSAASRVAAARCKGRKEGLRGITS